MLDQPSPNLPVVVFVRVCGKPEYEEGAQRWAESYRRFKPATSHDLVIVNRYTDAPNSSLDDLGAMEIRHDSGGWDCGTWKFVAGIIPAPLLVCFNSSTVIQCPGWLERFVEAAERHGKGIYGPLASWEIMPHIRTPCMAFQPEVMNRYPQSVPDRESTYRFESMGYLDGTPNVTQWARQQGYATRLVTRSGDFDIPDWKQPNVFRQGDQSDLLVRDRHCEAYAVSNPHGKAQLEHLAYGVMRSA